MKCDTQELDSTFRYHPKPQGKKMNLGFWNAQSIRNKISLIRDYISEHDLDIYLFAESWLKEDDVAEIGELQGDNLRYLSVPRRGRQGGGVACLFKSQLNVVKTDTPVYKTFESMEVNLTLSGKVTILVTIYRPEPSLRHHYTMSEFFNEFTELLAYYQNCNNDVIIVGDFNFHVNKSDNVNARKFLDILDMFNLVQHVSSSTHRDGNILDLLITRRDSTIVLDYSIDEQNSDHSNILFQLNVSKPPPFRKKIRFRRLKDIDVNSFKMDLSNRFAMLHSGDTSADMTIEHLDKLVDAYTSSKEVLDCHAPEIERTVTVRNPTPWNTTDIKGAKTEKRKAEKKWRKSKKQVDYERYRDLRNAFNTKLNEMRRDDLAKKINDNRDNAKNMFRAINSALNRKQLPPLPPHSNDEILADEFNEFFEDKIAQIRERLDSANTSPPAEAHEFQGEPLKCFRKVDEAEVKKILLNMQNKHCKLDPMPFWLMKECIDQFLPIITEIINASLQLGVMPKSLKHALVKPLLKKLSLELTKENYRPVSNLQVLGKVIESAVIAQFQEHLSGHNLQDSKQSAYKKFHSTETLLMKINNDIMSSLGKGEVVMLVLLDLSAAFDTIDHGILAKRLEKRYGIQGTALNWFKSYMSGRTQSVLINETTSKTKSINLGVPQGSKLGPILFNSYIAPISRLAEENGISDEKYADDHQLVLSFKPQGGLSQYEAQEKMEKCIQDIRVFLENNKLSNNGEKTEFLLIGSPAQLKHTVPGSIRIGDITVGTLDSVKNLGVIMDSNMTFDKQVSKMCKSTYFNLRNIAKIRKCLNTQDTKLAVNALVTPHLDYGNGLLFGVKKKLINKLQVAQNSAARLIGRLRKHDHISEYRKDLHWLPIEARIEFKILLMVWKALNNQAPAYLENLLNIRMPAINLRSRNRLLLDLPDGSGTNKYADRGFCRSAPNLWNKIPYEVRARASIESFKRGLKTYLFTKYYD